MIFECWQLKVAVASIASCELRSVVSCCELRVVRCECCELRFENVVSVTSCELCVAIIANCELLRAVTVVNVATY